MGPLPGGAISRLSGQEAHPSFKSPSNFSSRRRPQGDPQSPKLRALGAEEAEEAEEDSWKR